MNSNLTTERPTFVTHLECSMVGDRYEADKLHNLSKAGKPLLVRYDLAGVKKALTKGALRERPGDLWKWRELLPTTPLLMRFLAPTSWKLDPLSAQNEVGVTCC